MLEVGPGLYFVEMLPPYLISPKVHHRQLCYNMAIAPVVVQLQGQGGQLMPVLEVESGLYLLARNVTGGSGLYLRPPMLESAFGLYL